MQKIFLLSESRDSVTAVINWYAYKSVHAGTLNFNSNQFGAAFRLNSLMYSQRRGSLLVSYRAAFPGAIRNFETAECRENFGVSLKHSCQTTLCYAYRHIYTQRKPSNI